MGFCHSALLSVPHQHQFEPAMGLKETWTDNPLVKSHVSIILNEALEGFLGKHGFWPKTLKNRRFFFVNI